MTGDDAYPQDWSDMVWPDDFYDFMDPMLTKRDILWAVEQDIKEVEAGKVVEGHTESFRKPYLSLLKRFQHEIENTLLFQELEDYWCYVYEIDELGAKLYLEHFFREDIVDQAFELVAVPSKMLSVEEYAAVYGVGVTTVRQWIRRGKIRSAIKSGREWSIPELAEVTGRGYQTGNYFWNCHLNDLPEEFAFLNEGTSVTIFQNKENKEIYDISLSLHKAGDEKRVTMSTAEKERFELLLISHPLVKAILPQILVRA